MLLTLPTAVFEAARQDDLVRIRAQFPYFWSADAAGDFLDLLVSYNRAIRRTAVEEQVPLVAFDQVFSRAPRDAFLFFDAMHTNPYGMEVIAAAILELLVRDNLLQSPRARDDDAPGAAHS